MTQMLQTAKKKLTGRSGFSLAETLVVVVIVLLATSIAATAIPVALKAYRNVVSVSNAQSLLTTATTRLKDELGTATDISVKDNTISYINGMGSRSMISNKTEDDTTDICLQEYAFNEEDLVQLEQEDKKPVYQHRLVSDEAANKELHITYETVVYRKGKVTFTGLKVNRKEQTIAEQDQYEIRVIPDHYTH